ncbi:site-specific integrase [soil metagenome]
MAGQIIAKGPKKWLVRVYIGRDGQGKRKYIAELVHGGKKEAEAKRAELLTQKTRGTLAVRPKERVGDYLDAWLETTVQPSVRARTLNDYTRVVDRYIRPYLAEAQLSKLSPVEVRAMLIALRARGLSPRTVRMAHEVLRNALEQAVSDRLIPDNPARARLVAKALPQKVRKEPVTITGDAVGNFLDVASGDRLAALWVLGLMSGLRPSEALALRWSDVSGHTISVTRVLVDKKSGLEQHFEKPKSAASRRAVVVPDVVMESLRAHRKRQAEERLAAGPAWTDHELIFCDPTGNPLLQDSTRHQFRKLCKAAELPPGMTVYGLRHSCATLLLEKGVPLKVVSERLGHSTIALTADVYSHVTPSMQQQAADVLGDLAR